MPPLAAIQSILVPQGAEYQAVCRGLNQVATPKPQVIPIPVGPQAVSHFLNTWKQPHDKSELASVLVMGLCGSLKPAHRVGECVLYRDCVDLSHTNYPVRSCDQPLTEQIQTQLQLPIVKALTSDRIIHTASEKVSLAATYDTAVVDMEGFAVLQALSQLGIAVAMLRVVSDDCQHDVPDLTAALSPEGTLQPIPLAIGLIRQPIAGFRLIRGSLRGLQALQQVTAVLFNP